MMFWIIAAVVVVVLGSLVWWSSGRQRRGVDVTRLRQSQAQSQSKGGMQSGRPYSGEGPGTGGPFGPQGM